MQHRADNAHGAGSVLRSLLKIGPDILQILSLRIAQGISLLCDREGNHLKALLHKDLPEASPLLWI